MSGTALAGLNGFDQTMKNFLQARRVSAGALAITRNGRLLLTRGYTWSADPTLDVQPTSLFRIASLSKPITAAAVLRLVQDGELNLTDRVTELLTLTPPPGTTADPRLNEVTVLHLLQHRGGWDRANSGDPMLNDHTIHNRLGLQLPIRQADIIRYATGLPLDHAPGTTFAYSNYGYMLLGRIIEQVSGHDYATYVQEQVLAPCGVTRMRLGKTLEAGRAPGEVPYVSEQTGPTVLDSSGISVPAPYGTFNLENMDAHGGWLGTAIDLTRVTAVFDASTPVLDNTSVAQALAPPAALPHPDGSYYGCGWMIQPDHGGLNTWHNGALAGSSTLLVRRHDAVTWAVLLNQRDDPKDPAGTHYAQIGQQLHTTADTITTWPPGDLNSSYP